MALRETTRAFPENRKSLFSEKLFFQALEDRLHLTNFLPLAIVYFLTQFLNLRILKRIFITHQNCSRVVWNHRAQKLPVVDFRLLPDGSEEKCPHDEASADKRR